MPKGVAQHPKDRDGEDDVDSIGSAIIIRVKDHNGRPAANYLVDIGIAYRGYDGTAEETLSRLTTDSGQVDIGIDPWSVDTTCMVTAGAHGKMGIASTWTEVRRGETKFLDLELRRAFEFSGRVVSTLDGAPVPGATVTSTGSPFGYSSKTDLAGEFVFEYFPLGGQGIVDVSARGYSGEQVELNSIADGSWNFRSWETPTDGGGQLEFGPAYVVVALLPARTIVGQIVTPDGTPVVGARVRAEGHYYRAKDVASSDSASGESSTDGRFEVIGLRADIHHRLDLRANGFSAAFIEVPPVGPGVVDCGTVVLGQDAEIAGIVTDSDGRPAQGLTLRAQLEYEPTIVDVGRPVSDDLTRDFRWPFRPEFSTTTNADGFYACDGLPPGRYGLSVIAGSDILTARFLESEGKRYEFEVSSQTTDSLGLDIGLSADTVSVSGTVDSPMELSGGRIALLYRGRIVHRTIPVDPDGRFRVCGLLTELLSAYTLTATVRLLDGRVATSEALSASEVQGGNALRVKVGP